MLGVDVMVRPDELAHAGLSQRRGRCADASPA
jgi:hypothetical protein